MFLLKKTTPYRRLIAAGLFSAILILWPFFVANRGADPTDTAYALAGYMKVLANPASAPANRALSSWLSILPLAGATSGQWLMVRILGAAACGGLVLFTVFSLYPLFPLRTLLPLLLAATLIAAQFPAIIGYNALSYLFFACAIWLLLRGFSKDRRHWFALSGALIGLNLFIRLPNLLQFTLAAVVIWRYGCCGRAWKKAFSRARVFLLAAFLSAAAFFTLCLVILGPTAVLSGLSAAAGNALAAPTGEIMTYSLPGMVQNFSLLLAQSLGPLLPLLCTVLVAGECLLFIKLRHRVWRVLSLVLGAAALCGAAALGWRAAAPLAMPSSFPPMLWSALVGAICYLVCAIALVFYRLRNPACSTAAACALVILTTMPFGTNTLFIAYTNYWHFTLPATASLGHCLWSDFCAWAMRATASGGRAPHFVTSLFPALLLGVCLTQCAAPAALHPYMDAPYAQLTAPVNNIPVLAGMRTTPENAAMLEAYVETLAPFEGQTLINMGLFASGPLITGMEPAFGNGFPALGTVSEEAFRLGLEAAGQAGALPVVTFTDVSHSGWLIDESDPKTRLLLDFLGRHRYALYHADDSLLVYVPPGAPRAGGPAA